MCLPNRPPCCETWAWVLQTRKETQALPTGCAVWHCRNPTAGTLLPAIGAVWGFEGNLASLHPTARVLPSSALRTAKESTGFPLQMACLTDARLLNAGGKSCYLYVLRNGFSLQKPSTNCLRSTHLPPCSPPCCVITPWQTYRTSLLIIGTEKEDKHL